MYQLQPDCADSVHVLVVLNRKQMMQQQQQDCSEAAILVSGWLPQGV